MGEKGLRRLGMFGKLFIYEITHSLVEQFCFFGLNLNFYHAFRGIDR